ncbi:MAG TPA: hypothetical protein VGS60_05560 [Actinomycetes bacterium]|nr:hypothetical protein [Actinomycetes bacterium]
MRSLPSVTLGVAALAAPVFAFGAEAGPAWGSETPPFNIEVILRDVAGGSGFGHVKFRQPNDTAKIVHLDTWVRDLAPNHAYRLQRAVDTTLDGNCPRVETDWLTLGKGLVPQVITTDDRGTGGEDLFRDLAAVPTGKQFDINFRVIEAVSSAPVLESGCYRFTVDL